MYQKNVTFKKMLSFFLMGSSYLYSMEDTQRLIYDRFKNDVIAGSAAGLVEVAINQPGIFLKNASQQKQNVFKRVKESPSIMYKGLGVGMVCMVPTTAAQVSISNSLKSSMPGDDLPTVFARNGAAGLASVGCCNISELIVVNQQNLRTNALTTGYNLYTENGIKVAFRGGPAKAGRDTIFCIGFLTTYAQVKNRLRDERQWSDGPATLAAAALVGPITAVVSHPFDTISTNQQADPAQRKFYGLVDTARKLYRQGGVSSLFLGLPPRAGRIVVAIPVMNKVSHDVAEILNSRERMN